MPPLPRPDSQRQLREMPVGSVFSSSVHSTLSMRPRGLYVKISETRLSYVGTGGVRDYDNYSFDIFSDYEKLTIWRSGWDGVAYGPDGPEPLEWPGVGDVTQQWR